MGIGEGFFDCSVCDLRAWVMMWKCHSDGRGGCRFELEALS